MNNIYNAFNVKNEFELTKLIESFDLSNEEEAELYSSLNESMSVDGIRYIITELTKKYANGSYEKLQEQLSKQPFKRTLKENIMPSLEDLWKDIVAQYKDLGYGDFDDEDLLRVYNNVYGFLSTISNNFPTSKRLDLDAHSIGRYYDDEVIREFRREVNDGYIDYFGEYEDFDDMLNNGSEVEMFEALLSNHKFTIVERLVNSVNLFVQENEKELFNSNFDEPKKEEQPEDNGDNWLEESNDVEWYMKQLNSAIHDMGPDGKIIKDIANNDDDSEDDILDSIFTHFASIIYRLEIYMHYAPARKALNKINNSVRDMAATYRDGNTVQHTEEENEEFERWIDIRLRNGEYFPIVSKFGIDGKYDVCMDIYDLAKELYTGYMNRDYDEVGKKVKAPVETGDEWIEESYDVNKEPLFDIGDEVSFKWGDKEVTGRIIGSKMIGSNEYFDIVSYNTERKRRENYTQVCPVSNEMKKINEGEF